MIKRKGDFINSLFIRLVAVELILFPVLYVGEYALGLDYGASYFLRFFYILYGLLVLFLVLFRQKIYFNILSALLLLSLMIGLMRSPFIESGNFSISAFFSHVFYFAMPIFAMSFGANFYPYFLQIKDDFGLWVRRLAVFGLIVVLCFFASKYFGYSPYNSVDIWNPIIGMSYLLPIGGWGLYLAAISVFLTQKRTAIAVAAVIVSIFISSKYKPRYILLYLLSTILISFVLFQTGTGLDRVDNTFLAIQKGDFQFVFSGRLEEAMQVVKELGRESLGPMMGLGLGIQYYPWPDIPGNENYVSHSAHIAFFSYALVIGYPLAIGIFVSIFIYTIRLVVCLVRNDLRDHDVGIILLFITFLLASLVGGSMVNNPLFWILLGCNIQMLKYVRGINQYDNDM